MKKFLAYILEHKWTGNITGILNILVAIVVPVEVYFLQKADTTGSKPDTGSHWSKTGIFLLIIIGVFVLIQAVSFLNAWARRKKIREQEVIRKLSALQQSCILTPHYVTAIGHATHSKEGALVNGGTANILTNSLKYDMFYSEIIAENIIKGAKYIYILPNTSFMIEDLQNYIIKICESIQEELRKQHCNDVVNKSDELRSNNLEFCFFDDENLCLYNFAIFRQIGLKPFVQYWWYVNPSDTNSNSPMLSHEILAHKEKIDLDDVFNLLKKDATKKTGKDVFDNRTKLSDLIGGKQ